MIYVEAPNTISVPYGSVAVFLAGGITNCPDFQTEIAEKLSGSPDTLILFNPRRKNFPIHDPSAAEAQIKWEFEMLRKALCISFWFPKETLCPIVLYELGSWSMTKKPLVIGAHPQYARLQDVTIQTSLVRPGHRILNNLNDVVMGIKYWHSQLLM
jgi:hypothetical protein